VRVAPPSGGRADGDRDHAAASERDAGDSTVTQPAGSLSKCGWQTDSVADMESTTEVDGSRDPTRHGDEARDVEATDAAVEGPHMEEQTGNMTNVASLTETKPPTETDDRTRLLKRGLTESPSSEPAVCVDTDIGSRLMGTAQAVGDQVKGGLCETSSIKAETDGCVEAHRAVDADALTGPIDSELMGKKVKSNVDVDQARLIDITPTDRVTRNGLSGNRPGRTATECNTAVAMDGQHPKPSRARADGHGRTRRESQCGERMTNSTPPTDANNGSAKGENESQIKLYQPPIADSVSQGDSERTKYGFRNTQTRPECEPTATAGEAVDMTNVHRAEGRRPRRTSTGSRDTPPQGGEQRISAVLARRQSRQAGDNDPNTTDEQTFTSIYTTGPRPPDRVGGRQCVAVVNRSQTHQVTNDISSVDKQSNATRHGGLPTDGNSASSQRDIMVPDDDQRDDTMETATGHMTGDKNEGIDVVGTEFCNIDVSDYDTIDNTETRLETDASQLFDKEQHEHETLDACETKAQARQNMATVQNKTRTVKNEMDRDHEERTDRLNQRRIENDRRDRTETDTPTEIGVAHTGSKEVTSLTNCDPTDRGDRGQCVGTETANGRIKGTTHDPTPGDDCLTDGQKDIMVPVCDQTNDNLVTITERTSGENKDFNDVVIDSTKIDICDRDVPERQEDSIKDVKYQDPVPMGDEQQLALTAKKCV